MPHPAIAMLMAGQSSAYYTDDFNRADGGLGSNWTVIDAGFSILGNELITDPSANNLWVSSVSAADQFAQIDVSSWAYTGSNVAAAGLFVRSNSGLTAYYLAQIIRHAAGGLGETWRIIDSATGVVASTASAFPSTPFTMRFEARDVGSNIETKFYKVVSGTSTLMVSYTDTPTLTSSAGRYVGINGSQNSGTTVKLDNFVAGPL